MSDLDEMLDAMKCDHCRRSLFEEIKPWNGSTFIRSTRLDGSQGVVCADCVRDRMGEIAQNYLQAKRKQEEEDGFTGDW